MLTTIIDLSGIKCFISFGIKEYIMCDKKIKLLKPIVTACGDKPQMLQSIEELSELQKAICKYLKSPKEETKEAITEEMADVSIMLDQLMIIFDNEQEMQQVVAQKIDRTYKRLGIDK